MRRTNRRLRKRASLDTIDTPMVEIFGGTLALLIILFALINLIVSEDIRAMLERSTENAEFKVSWTNGGEGLVVITYPEKLHILETNQSVASQNICDPQSVFMQYVNKIYQVAAKQQIIFAITEGSVKTMAVARNCMLKRNPKRAISIGWIVANSDLLNTVKLEDFPAHIKRALTKPR